MPGIVPEYDPGAGQIIVWAQQLIGIKFLEGLIFDTTDEVGVGKHGVTIAIRIGAQNSSVADASRS